MTQAEKAERFRRLHEGPEILVLPNAWDVATARIVELAGYSAVATTSAGIAASLGYPDGECISRDEMLSVVARIVRAVSIPVTADVESGYGDPLETARAVAATGAIGINLEDVTAERGDTLADLDRQTALIHEMQALGLPLVINARTDIFLGEIGETATRVARTIQRLNAYRDAGADCLFAPGVRDLDTITTLAQEIGGPLNILAVAGSPAVPELHQAGVKRVSIGSGGSRAALGLFRRIAMELKEQGTYTAMLDGQIPFAEVNRMLAGANRKH